MTLSSSIQAIIYSNDTHYEQNIKSWIPIFTIQQDDYNIIKIREDYFVQIVFFNQSKLKNSYLFYISICFGLIMSLLSGWWFLNTYRYNFAHTTQLQKSVSFFPLMRMVLACLLVYYFEIKQKQPESNENELVPLYIEIIMLTLVFVYKTFFWFITFLIASGWQLYQNILSSRDLRQFSFFYMLIFLLTCIDQILDMLFKQKFYIVSSLLI